MWLTMSLSYAILVFCIVFGQTSTLICFFFHINFQCLTQNELTSSKKWNRHNYYQIWLQAMWIQGTMSHLLSSSIVLCERGFVHHWNSNSVYITQETSGKPLSVNGAYLSIVNNAERLGTGPILLGSNKIWNTWYWPIDGIGIVYAKSPNTDIQSGIKFEPDPKI